MSGRSGRGLEGWALRCFLRFYPSRFRRLYGAELLELYRQLGDERERGVRWLLRLGAESLWHGTAARLEAARRASRRRSPAPAATQLLTLPSANSRGRIDMTSLGQDVRYGRRQLMRYPGFSAVALLALGLGIGANVAIFSVVNGVYLHDLPYAEVDRVMMVWEDQSSHGGTVRSPASPANFLDWQERSRSFAELAALRNESRRLTGLDEPVVPLTHRITPNYFALLGVEPALGRGFGRRDGQVRDSVIISHGLWQGPLGGDPEIIGRPLELAGESFTIIGVMGPDFYSHHQFLTQPDLWLPSDLSDESSMRGDRQLLVFGRLADGVSSAAAQEELVLLAKELAREYPRTNADWSVLVEPIRENVIGSLRQTFLLLLGAVGLVLLIACTNVANLFLARTAQRRHEVVLRTALGASAWRVTRQLLVEGLLLSLVGGGLGVLLSMLLVPAVRSLIPEGAGVPFVEHVGIDLRVLFFALVVSITSGLLFGLAPARQWARASLAPGLREGGRGGGAGRRAVRQGAALIGAEVALAVVVVIGAGLMMQSFLRLRGFDPGFDPERLFTIRTSLRGATFAEPTSRWRHFAELEARLSALPGVESVGSVSFLPPLNSRFVSSFSSPGVEQTPGNEPRAMPRAVTGGYFETMRIPLLAGRWFDARDRADTTPVVIVNEALVRRYFSGHDPVGQTFILGSDARGVLGPGIERQIVGVVGNVLTGGANPEPQPAFYIPHTQAAVPIMNVVMRTSVEPLSLARAAEREFWTAAADVNVYGLQTLEEAVANTQWRTSFSTLLLSTFALLALLLGAAGIYAVISHAMAQRTREIGVRISLGARTADVARMVLGASLRPTVVGIVVGSVAALFVTRLLQGLLFGVTATDPWTFVGVAVVLLGAALLASLIPALRAARLDPVRALRLD